MYTMNTCPLTYPHTLDKHLNLPPLQPEGGQEFNASPEGVQPAGPRSRKDVERLSHTRSLSLTHTLTHTHTHTHSYIHSLSAGGDGLADEEGAREPPAATPTLSLSHTHNHAVSLSLTHTHTHTHSHTHTLSLSLSHTHTHSRQAAMDLRMKRGRGGRLLRARQLKVSHLSSHLILSSSHPLISLLSSAWLRVEGVNPCDSSYPPPCPAPPCSVACPPTCRMKRGREGRLLRARQLKVCLYLTQSVFKVVLQKSTPPQVRQLILYYY